MNKNKFDKIKIKLKNASVGIAGIGGLGSNASIALARAGIGRLVLVDFDKVDINNLDRQYYFLDQIGQLKVNAMKENIRRIDPKIKVEAYNLKGASCRPDDLHKGGVFLVRIGAGQNLQKLTVIKQ